MMIGFFLAESKSSMGYVLADMMIRSAREWMPGVEIVQFSDEKSSKLYGVDRIERKDGQNIMRLRLEHYTISGEWLFVDTDLLTQGDVRGVFDSEFDIAVADRVGSILPSEIGGEFMSCMPYNLGVVFSRSPEFWREALKRWELFSDTVKADIISDQLAVCETIKESKFKVKVLPGIPYNLSPMSEEQDTSNALLVHYKGARKFWMMRKLYLELGLVI